MNLRKQTETAETILNNYPRLEIAPSRVELLILRRQLADAIAESKAELEALSSSSQENGQENGQENATLALQLRLLAHFHLVHGLKTALIKKAVDLRLSQVSPCQFQMMVDCVPYYYFYDHATGLRFDGIAYGTEANRVMYKLKADLTRAVTASMNAELSEVDEALDSLKGQLRNFSQATAVN